MLLFVIGSAMSAAPAGPTWLALDPAGNFLHLALAIVAAALGMAMAAPWLKGDRTQVPRPPVQQTQASDGSESVGR